MCLLVQLISVGLQVGWLRGTSGGGTKCHQVVMTVALPCGDGATRSRPSICQQARRQRWQEFGNNGCTSSIIDCHQPPLSTNARCHNPFAFAWDSSLQGWVSVEKMSTTTHSFSLSLSPLFSQFHWMTIKITPTIFQRKGSHHWSSSSPPIRPPACLIRTPMATSRIWGWRIWSDLPGWITIEMAAMMQMARGQRGHPWSHILHRPRPLEVQEMDLP